MKKVVIFGGAGSIGLSLIKYLLSEGKYEITIVDLKNKETIKRLKRYKKELILFILIVLIVVLLIF